MSSAHEMSRRPRTTNPRLERLARPSGAFAMLALDQREALRVMMEEARARPVRDEELTAFKLEAAATLTPLASAVLLDRQFALDEALASGTIAEGCAVVAAADRFLARGEELVAESLLDENVDLFRYAEQGVAAAKLLVVWRPDEHPDDRRALVSSFVERCASAGLASIIEPVSRPPRSNSGWSWDAGVIGAAHELGDLGADLYKAEVPFHGSGDEGAIGRACAELDEAIASPWVVLSSGVPPASFPRAVELAMANGASGFLAGRAIWRSCLAAKDLGLALRSEAAPRLKALCDIVDRAIAA